MTTPLQLPAILVQLIETDRWPRKTLCFPAAITKQRVRAIFPEEDELYFFAPPFHTLAYRVRNGDEFWHSPFCAPTELALERSVLIGDFGLGSDAPVILDYQGSAEPRVRYLRTGFDHQAGTHDNHWETAAGSFNEFAQALGLASTDWSRFRGSTDAGWPPALLLD
jgi:hypothetical protein